MKRIIGGRGKSLPLRLPIKVQTVKMKDVIFVQRIDFGFSDNGVFQIRNCREILASQAF